MLEYVRAVRDLRPRWLLWESVPGVLSQDGGRAFGTLLGALERLRGILSRGECLTLDSSEWPSDAAVCSLSAILEPMSERLRSVLL